MSEPQISDAGLSPAVMVALSSVRESLLPLLVGYNTAKTTRIYRDIGCRVVNNDQLVEIDEPNCISNKLAKLRRHASAVHFAKIHLG